MDDDIEERKLFLEYIKLFQSRHNDIDTKLFDLTKLNFIACSAIGFISNTSYLVSKLPTGVSFIFFGVLIVLISVGARAMAIYYAKFAYANSLTAFLAHKSWAERRMREFPAVFGERIPQAFKDSGEVSWAEFFLSDWAYGLINSIPIVGGLAMVAFGMILKWS